MGRRSERYRDKNEYEEEEETIDSIECDGKAGSSETSLQGSSLSASSMEKSDDNSAQIIDTKWAERSCALYSTCRAIPDLLYHPDNEGNLTTVINVCENRPGEEDAESRYNRVLCVCLDFIWGRGVLQTDLEWLSFVCDRLEL